MFLSFFNPSRSVIVYAGVHVFEVPPSRLTFRTHLLVQNKTGRDNANDCMQIVVKIIVRWDSNM